MSFLDQFLFGQSASDLSSGKNNQDIKLVDLDLSSLVSIILGNVSNRFYWSRFSVEFINRLEIQTRLDFRFFDFGVSNVGFLVKAQDLDQFYDQLKDFANRFQYWKYFEDGDAILAKLIQPKISMSPMSAHAYLTKVSQTEIAIKDYAKSSKKTWNLIEPKTSMDM
jgi:hypothetical protein